MDGSNEEIDVEGKKYRTSNLNETAKNIIRNLEYLNAHRDAPFFLEL